MCELNRRPLSLGANVSPAPAQGPVLILRSFWMCDPKGIHSILFLAFWHVKLCLRVPTVSEDNHQVDQVDILCFKSVVFLHCIGGNKEFESRALRSLMMQTRGSFVGCIQAT